MLDAEQALMKLRSRLSSQVQPENTHSRRESIRAAADDAETGEQQQARRRGRLRILPRLPGFGRGREQRPPSAQQGSCAYTALTAVRSNPMASAVAGLLTAYATLRLSVAAFHHSRRAFLRRLLADLCPALDELGVAYWLDFGCLLGIHRDGDLILHDNDVDLAVSVEPQLAALLEGLHRLLPPRYSIKVITPPGQPGSSWIRVYCPLGMADLFGAYQSEGGDEVFVDCGHGDTMHIAAGLVLPPGKRRWRGRFLNVPADVEGTLERRYGAGWRTPAYMDKGADDVEGSKPYARLFRALARLGIRI